MTFIPEMDTLVLGGNNYKFLLLSILFLLIMIIFSYFCKRKVHNRLQLPPGPYAWPVIGNILDLDADKPHTWLAKIAEEYGPLFSLKLGAKVLVIASSPATAKEILKTHDRDLSGRYKSKLSAAIPELKSSAMVLSAECNESWRFLRRTTHSELFSARALELHTKLRAKKAQEMLEFLVAKEGEVVEIANVVYTAIVNILTNTLMSKDLIESLDTVADLKKFSRGLIEFAVPGIADIFPMMGAMDFGIRTKARGHKEKSRSLWNDIVRERREKHEDGASDHDFLDVLLQNSFDDDQIFNVFSELFVTSDSVSTTMEWAIAELTRNQEAFSRLRDEIMEAIEGTVLSESQLTKLPYLQACIKETLRLHPPNPFLVPHCALETCKVMNYDVPKNSLVVVNIYAIGREPKIWEDPLSFRPERFLAKNLDVKGTHYELLPFGGGRRVCVGIPLALRQIQLLLASLVYGFDWFLPSGVDPAKLDMRDKFSIPLGREKPLHLIFKKRNELNIE